MDPATIIGTTSAILSFIQFTGQIISTGVKIYNGVHGASENHFALESTVSDFDKVFENVQSQIFLTSSPTVINASTDYSHHARDSLQRTLTECQSLGKRIADILQKTKAAPGNNASKLDRLRRWRHARNKSSKGPQTPPGLTPRKPTIFEVMKASIWTIWHEGDLDDLRKDWKTCIIQFQVDLSNFKTSESLASIHIALQTQSQQLDEIHHLVRSLVEGGQLVQLVTFVNRLQEADSLEEMEKRNVKWILEALDFPGIDARRNQVETAAEKTFEWCVKDESVPEGLPNLKISFRQWLRTGSGIYHITGKPGSGKSTLVKFLDNADETQEQLAEWACGKKLVRASFYAWRAAQANQLQNQFEGLTRTILYQILDAAPELAGIAFPSLWMPLRFTLLNSISHHYSKPSKPKLSGHNILDALENILQPSDIIKNYRLFLLVDGMDEFEETNTLLHTEIAKRILSWSSYSLGGVKICASSRKEPAFMDDGIFKPIERLRLHLFTKNDIRELVTHRLTTDYDYFTSMEQHQDLIELIVDRAEGVFLWVVLVTREIQHLIIEKQSFQDLSRAVEIFPDELNKVFFGILQRIRQSYKEEAWAVFTVALHFVNWYFFDLFYFSLLRECLSDQSEDPLSMDQRLQEMSWDDAEYKVQGFIERFPSLCQGLLELVPGRPNGLSCLGWHSPAARCIVFSHRSVYDFMKESSTEIARTLAPKVKLSGPEIIYSVLSKAVDVLLDIDSYALSCITGGWLNSDTTMVAPSWRLGAWAQGHNILAYDAALLLKQGVISAKKDILSAEAKDLLITPNTLFTFFKTLIEDGGINYCNWMLENYPSWIRDKIFFSKTVRWLFEGHSNRLDDENLMPNKNFISDLIVGLSNLAMICNKPWLDWSVNEPIDLELKYIFFKGYHHESKPYDSVPLLHASVWLAGILFFLHIVCQEKRYKFDYKRYGYDPGNFEIRDLVIPLNKMLAAGPEQAIQFRWWHQKQGLRAKASVIYRRSNSRNKKYRRRPFTTKRLKIRKPLPRASNRFIMTVQEGEYPTQVVQDSRWFRHLWPREQQDIISLFVDEFGDSGCVQLKEVVFLLLNIVAVDDDAFDDFDFDFYVDEILNFLDDSAASTDDGSMSDELDSEAISVRSDTTESEQDATPQAAQLSESDHAVNEQGGSITIVPSEGEEEMVTTKHAYKLVNVFQHWQTIILAVQGTLISVLIWYILSK